MVILGIRHWSRESFEVSGDVCFCSLSCSVSVTRNYKHNTTQGLCGQTNTVFSNKKIVNAKLFCKIWRLELMLLDLHLHQLLLSSLIFTVKRHLKKNEMCWIFNLSRGEELLKVKLIWTYLWQLSLQRLWITGKMCNFGWGQCSYIVWLPSPSFVLLSVSVFWTSFDSGCHGAVCVGGGCYWLLMNLCSVVHFIILCASER